MFAEKYLFLNILRCLFDSDRYTKDETFVSFVSI